MDKKFCIECGASLNGTAIFCTACGRRQPNFVPRPAARPVNNAVSAPAAVTAPEPVAEAATETAPVPAPVTETAAETAPVPEPETAVHTAESAAETAASEIPKPSTAEETEAARSQPMYTAPEPIQVETIAAPEEKGGLNAGYIAIIAGALAVVALLMWSILAMNRLIVTDREDTRSSSSSSVYVSPQPDDPPDPELPDDDYSGVGGYLTALEL